MLVHHPQTPLSCQTEWLWRQFGCVCVCVCECVCVCVCVCVSVWVECLRPCCPTGLSTITQTVPAGLGLRPQRHRCHHDIHLTSFTRHTHTHTHTHTQTHLLWLIYIHAHTHTLTLTHTHTHTNTQVRSH